MKTIIISEDCFTKTQKEIDKLEQIHSITICGPLTEGGYCTVVVQVYPLPK